MSEISRRRLFGVFAWIGLTSLGGGRTAYIYEATVERRRWFTPEDFFGGLALSQLLPGPNVSNLCVFLGQRLRGASGAALAFFGVLLPGALAVLGLSVLYFDHGVGPGLDAALRGMGAGAAAFMGVITVRMAAKVRRVGGRGAAPLAALAFVSAGLLRLNVLWVLLALGAVSLWLNRPPPQGGDAPGTEGLR